MLYQKLDPSLPDVGASLLGPKRVSSAGALAITESTSVPGLAALRGYLVTYVGPAGGMIATAVGSVIAGILGKSWWVVGLLVAFIFFAHTVLEVRRRAHQWRALVDARLTQLSGASGRASSGASANKRDFAPTGLLASLFGRGSDE